MNNSGVSFDEENKLIQQTAGSQSTHFGGMSGWLVRKGLASNQTSADLTLVLLTIVCTGIAIYFFINNGASSNPRSSGGDLGAPPVFSGQKL